MSLRIRKVLGYALTDVVLSDPRINWDSPLLDLVGVRSTFSDFVKHLEATGPFADPEPGDQARDRDGRSDALLSGIYGLRNVLACGVLRHGDLGGDEEFLRVPGAWS